MAKELCKRIKDNEQLKEPDKYLAKVLPATKLCIKCGRVARDEKYVCKPKNILS